MTAAACHILTKRGLTLAVSLHGPAFAARGYPSPFVMSHLNHIGAGGVGEMRVGVALARNVGVL